jgi:pyroglutamyl-peptidase
MRALIAGFGPFPGAPFNPSALLAKALVRRRRPALAAIERSSHVFATAYGAVDRDLKTLLAQKPDIVLIFGLAGRRRHVCIETRARNAVSVLLPDASGYRPKSGTIARGAPPSRQGKAPFARLLGAVRAQGVPARMSRDAGRYLCNYVYWQALERMDKASPMVAFVHIPQLRLMPRRQGKTRHSPSLAQLVAVAESLLITLIAASRN